VNNGRATGGCEDVDPASPTVALVTMIFLAPEDKQILRTAAASTSI
jgi:hypothetical protein